jgi:hypothetical protein
LLAVLACLTPVAASAEEKKDQQEEKKPEPPRVTLVLPLAVTPGSTNTLSIRGQNLTNVTELRFTNETFKATADIRSRPKPGTSKEADAKKAGDGQLEVELTLPADAEAGRHYFILVSPEGRSAPHVLLVVPKAVLTGEMEPNSGFRQPQDIAPGRPVLGGIREANDVDVFRLHCRAGERLLASIEAARFGSSLDSVLTLYNAAGHLLARNDDAAGGVDSLLRWLCPEDGQYFLCVQDAHDRGGQAHPYLLTVTLEK